MMLPGLSHVQVPDTELSIETLDPTTTSGASVVGIWGILLLSIVAFIKVWPSIKQLQLGSDAAVRADLQGRVNELETRIAHLEKLLARQQQEHSAIEQTLRHDLANETSTLDAFILIAKTNPDKILELLPEIESMRQRKKDRIALEKGALAAASIKLADTPL
jgi:hypothetical protein